MLVRILGVIFRLHIYLGAIATENGNSNDSHPPFRHTHTPWTLFLKVLVEATLKCSHSQLQFQTVQNLVSKYVYHFLIEYFQKLTCSRISLT